jgi:uncharacterized protein (TIRG00374 family)
VVAGEESTEPAPSSIGNRFGSRLALGLLLGVVVYGLLVLWADAGDVLASLREFPLRWLFAAMGLSFTNYLVRFLRWEIYRRRLGIRLGLGDSFSIHLAGLALTVTPGKLGEAFKSWLVREVDGTPISKSAPIVLAERFTDLVAFLVLVAVGGLTTAPQYAWVFWATLGLCALLLFGLSSRAAGALGVRLLARLPLVAKLAPRVEVMLASTRVLLSPALLPIPTLLATLGWSLECYGFLLVAGAFAPEGLSYAFATYTFALSAVAGAVLILFPGGLGVTEGTMSALLTPRYVAQGLAPELARARAASATILIRLATLWFAVGVGLVAWWVFRWRRRRRLQSP